MEQGTTLLVLISLIILSGIFSASETALVTLSHADDFTLHQCLTFPLTKPISKIFQAFQAKRIHIAVILDEYGSTAGIVTMEDVLEEIVGDINDEYDDIAEPIVKIGKSSYLVDAQCTPEEIGKFYKIQTDVPGHKTLAFLILKKLKAFPREGELISLKDVDLTVKKMKGNSIQKVEMRMKLK